ncbi:hypothetical protein [Actinoplanes subglobosus]|uniref:Alkaline shock response membrane anchor protein AmaP n=1 Tax=Actinoplanes subglobosus TaxID=1547892 RepID=A0ABV8JDK1_9ACTN
MRRLVLGLDRTVTLVLGSALIAAGIVLVFRPGLRPRLDAVALHSATGQPWWPWACALLAITGVWWLLAHLPRPTIAALLLPGSGQPGRLLLDPRGPATLAAEILAETPGVRSAHGRVLRDRGQIVVVINAVAEPHANLDDIADAADAVTADLHAVLDRDDVTARVNLAVAGKRRALPRVS